MHPARPLPALDGLRGVAALLVVLAHAANHDLGPSLLEGAGRHGVFLFFVLSSFLLTRQLLEPALAPGGLAGWCAWAARRLRRVLPGYLAAVLAYAVLDGWSRQRLLGHLTLTESWFHLWTIPVELQAYLALPLVALAHGLLGRRRERTALLLALAIVGTRLAFPPDYASGSPPFLPVFLTGSLLACLPEERLRAAGGMGWIGVLAFAALLPGLHAVALDAPLERMRFHLQFEVFTAGAAALLVAGASDSGVLARVLGTAPLRAVGRLSYSLYLLHMLVLARVLEFGAGLGEPVAWLLYLAMSLSLAFASERLVERPLRARSSGPVSSSTQATPPGS